MGILTKAYRGKAIITFNESKHYYTVNVPGVIEKLYQPSVTSAIGMLDKSGALVSWAVDQMHKRCTSLMANNTEWDRDSVLAVIDTAKDSWRKSKEEAADIGSLAHRYLEQTLLGESPERPRFDPMTAPSFSQDMIDQANNAIDAGLQFLEQNHIELVMAEGVRWSPTHGYIGTGDLVAKFNGKLSILDWKTSKRLYDTVKLQLSAYAAAYTEEFPGQVIENRVGINIGKDGKLTVGEYGMESHEEDFHTFLALLDVWRWNRKNQGKWSQDVPPRLSQSQLQHILTQ